MKRIISRALSVVLLVLAGTSAWAQSEGYVREYTLRTLDARVAELLVWDLCEKYGQKADVCKVQVAQGRSLVAWAPKEVHNRIVRMLVERDQEESAVQGFQIVLVRASAEGRGKAVPDGEIQKALDAVRELFPYQSFEIIDRGLIRTTDRGEAQLGSEATGMFNAFLRRRSSVTGMDGRELTVELELQHRNADGSPSRMMGSVLTLAEGETIVAGSSRLSRGDATLLVLLTALPKDFDR